MLACGRLMLGSGSDTYDPICELPAGHAGVCKSTAAIDQHRLSPEEKEAAWEASADKRRLREVCQTFLYGTSWAGELGDPVPTTHRASVDRRFVTELRHERRVCHETIGPDG